MNANERIATWVLTALDRLLDAITRGVWSRLRGAQKFYFEMRRMR